jgi:2-dehydropantoate 2-reductase
MKIVMMGAGGVGGFYGGRLAHAGYDVTFVARGAHLEALRTRGLTIENAQQGDLHLARVQATDDPGAIGTADVVVIAVKLWDTEAALRAAAPLVGPRTAVLSLQNGVVKDELLRRAFGEAAVIGAVGYVATQIARPGVIRQTGTLQRVAIGEYDGRRTPRLQALAEAFERAGIETEVSADIRRTLWEKFTFLVGLSGATATIRLPIGPIRSNPQTRAFLFELMKEVVAVGRARGVALPQDYAEQRLAFADTVPHDMTSSMHHDLERGRPLEVEWLSGAVVRLGAEAGVPTPANRAVWDILALHARGRAS